MSEVGKAKGGFSGTFEIGSKTKKSGEKRVSAHRRGIPDVHASHVSTKSRDLSTRGVKHRANLEGDKAGHKIEGFPIYGPIAREETKRVEHNDAMEREDRDRLMSLLQSKGLISKDGTYNGPGIFQYFTSENGGVERLIESINESDASYTPDGKARLYTADKDGITINFKVRGDYHVNSEGMKGTELIKLNPSLKLSWKDVVVWATEKPYSDRRPLPNGELPAENLMYLFFPVFKDVSGLSGSKSKNIQSVLMNGCIIYETRQYSMESAAFKYVKAQLEEKIASFEKKGNEKGAAGAKNALQYLNLIKNWALKNGVSFEDSLGKELPENVLKVLDRIITDAGEAKVSDKELLQAEAELNKVAGGIAGAIDAGDRRDNSKEIEILMDGLRNINEMVEGTLKKFGSIPMENGKISKENLDFVKRSLSLVENAVKLADDPRVRKYTTSSDYTEASSKLNEMIKNIFANAQEAQRIGKSLLTKIHAKKKK